MMLACIWVGLAAFLAAIVFALLASQVSALRMDVADLRRDLGVEFEAVRQLLPARIKPFNPASAPTPVQGRHSA